MDTFTTTSTVKHYPELPYETIKNDILGKTYTLSLAFVGPARAKSFNESYRQKDYVPNVLSFPLEKKSGEIIICPAVAKKEAAKFSLSTEGYIGYLFIHGCLHLKGLDHGDTMETQEAKYVRKYDLT